MGAPDILLYLREHGLTVEYCEPGSVVVRPASKLTPDLREQIRAHKAELIGMLTVDRVMASAPSQPSPATSCGTCTHRTPARTCGDPVAAGLADHFTLIWVDLIGGHGAGCPVHQAREQRQPQEALPRLTPGQVREVIGWDEAELARASRYMRQADRQGFDIEMAERITDHLMLRDRRGDELRMCLECRHLTLSGRCVAAASGRLDRTVQNAQPVKAMLFRCVGFTES